MHFFKININILKLFFIKALYIFPITQLQQQIPLVNAQKQQTLAMPQKPAKTRKKCQQEKSQLIQSQSINQIEL